MPARYGNEHSSMTKGLLSRRLVGSTGPYFPFGNCSVINTGGETEKKEVKRYNRAGGGNANSIERLSNVPINITMLDFTAQNKALALQGLATSAAAGTATDEEVTLFAGAITPLAHIPTAITSVEVKAGALAPNRANSTAYLVGDVYVPDTPNNHYYKVTVAGTSGASVPTFTTDGTTFTDGTATVQDMGLIVIASGNYSRTLGGIYVADAATFNGIDATTGLVALVAYTYPAVETVEAMVGIGQEWELYYEGEDEMQSGLVTRAWYYRAKFSAAQQVDMVADDPSSLQITGELLPDESITDPNKSQYFYIETVKKAA